MLPALAVVLLTRLPLFPRSVLDWDESLYAVIAEAWRAGHPPYSTIWDNKPPGIYAIFALAETVIADPVFAIRAAALLAAGLGAWLTHGLVRDLGGDAGAARIAAIAYAIASASNDGLAANTELFMVVFTAAAMRAALSGRAGLAGLLFGAGVIVKYVAIFEAPALLLAFFLSPRPDPRRLFRAAAGAALPGLFALAWFAHRGDAAPFLADTVAANLRRAALAAPPGALGAALIQQAIRWGPLYLAAFACRRRLVLVWLASALAGALSARLFYDHYFLQMLPALCAGAALALPPRRLRPALAALVLALPALAAGRAMADGLRPILGCGAAGCSFHPDTPRRLAALLSRDASLYIFDAEPILYALTATRPPTPYVLPSILTGRLAAIAGVDATAEVARILAMKPEFIVTRPLAWRDPRVENPAVYRELDAALAAGYSVIATYSDALLYRLGPVTIPP